ncbi:hypothetical protein AGABI2DRAFT_114052 [Agaricus bisporus var. bisporus H97]|uniref:hypothetical protein n=1 Tax=Agaricus bisporus var. bisporus (strain H97 / ATCC MYA-4626 / FGSC 10389) TaxID=936046 RepID=UPI00029F4F5C|nr:hypothetical protein AGABI2DRAFT_114052 [Agaricus bisporus var. bisporus H97]EKV51318.1 hypothetical protein AGABI2DRAFT_114052 [Agaricus bisporus var. bisporus H97]
MQCFSRPSSVFSRLYATAASAKADIASGIVLRPYQHECIHSCLDALSSGCTRIGVSLPTGSGKTTVFLSLLSQIPAPLTDTNATRSLVVVNSIELARQSAEQAARLFPHWSVEIEQGTKHNASGMADLTVATYQTLVRAERVRKFDPSLLKAIIIDEAHHSAAPSYRKLLSSFDPNILHPDRTVQPPVLPHAIPIIGFSATFSRHDGLALGSVFERIVYHRDFLDMIKEQWLCDMRFTSVKADLNLKEVPLNAQTGDFNPTSLAEQMNRRPINELVVKSWIDRAGARKSSLVFCVDIEHVLALTQTFRQHGIDARSIDSRTNPNERKLLVSQFRQGVFPVLVNCAILTEGADIPNIDCIVVARPTRSPNVYAQMIGRGMRLSPATGKGDCRILDFVDVTTQINVISLPSLFGLDPLEVAVEENVETLEFKSQAKAEMSTSQTTDHLSDPQFADATITYIDYEDPFSLMKDSSNAPNMFRLSRNAWVGCGDNIYVLPCLQFGDVRIQPVQSEEGEDLFEAYFLPQLDEKKAKAAKLPMFMRRRNILKASTLAEAVKGCDTYVHKKVLKGNLINGVLRSARWRKDPATEAQKNFCRKKWLNKKKGQGIISEENIDKITKGEAGNMITRLKHGAKASCSLLQEQFSLILS